MKTLKVTELLQALGRQFKIKISIFLTLLIKFCYKFTLTFYVKIKTQKNQQKKPEKGKIL